MFFFDLTHRFLKEYIDIKPSYNEKINPSNDMNARF